MGIPIFSQIDNRWREFYNPLRGLSLPKVLSMLEAGERGQFADLEWFYYYMERSDPMIFSIIQRRRAALMDSDWDIRVVSGARMRGARARGFDPTLAEEQAAFLSEVYDGIENFRDSLAFLFSGFFRGHAHVEKHFGENGEILRLEPVEQWFWVRDGMYGAWEYNENAVDGRTDDGGCVLFPGAGGRLRRTAGGLLAGGRRARARGPGHERAGVRVDGEYLGTFPEPRDHSRGVLHLGRR